MAFHVLFKSNPNVITSLCVRSERAMTRLTSWPLLCHGTGPGQKPQVYYGSRSQTAWSLRWDGHSSRRWRGLSMPLEVMVPWSQLCSCCSAPLGCGADPAPAFTAAPLESLDKSTNCLVFVSAFFNSGLQATRLPPGILSRWVSFLNLVKEDTLGRCEQNGPGEIGEVYF